MTKFLNKRGFTLIELRVVGGRSGGRASSARPQDGKGGERARVYEFDLSVAARLRWVTVSPIRTSWMLLIWAMR